MLHTSLLRIALQLALDPDELRIDNNIREKFSSTVESLRDFLAKNQPGAYMDIDIEWTELQQCANFNITTFGLGSLASRWGASLRYDECPHDPKTSNNMCAE